MAVDGSFWRGLRPSCRPMRSRTNSLGRSLRKLMIRSCSVSLVSSRKRDRLLAFVHRPRTVAAPDPFRPLTSSTPDLFNSQNCLPHLTPFDFPNHITELSLEGTDVAEVVSRSVVHGRGVRSTRKLSLLPTPIGVNSAVCAVSLYTIYGFLRI